MAAAAATAAACRRGMLLHQHHHYHHWQQAAWAGPGARSISQLVKTNGRRAFLVDTLALVRLLATVSRECCLPLLLIRSVRKLESQGVPTKQAEAITSAITEVLNDSLESISESFVSKAEMQKSEMLQESNISKFKSQVQSSQFQKISFSGSVFVAANSNSCIPILMLIACAANSIAVFPFLRAANSVAVFPFLRDLFCLQENHFSLLQRETEKLRGDIDKMRSELKYEIDKVTAGQRLDLNLERGRIRDELAKQNEETTELTTKLDKEIHSLKAQLEAAKYDVIKYCIGTIVSISAVGLAVLRIIM
ncbi:hypothetical protein PR202_ga14384 [Eleusine coracana subsp. coracana]|uniref:Uncharacterized protein n=1 Tax=Eleusine coracana subsp. coracana TaxID=191504 RepID=A0AAV5CH41_ELECO|nr:hypothetical protein PR202_ga14384 [Eleusine coracana subsp. coracana]